MKYDKICKNTDNNSNINNNFSITDIRYEFINGNKLLFAEGNAIKYIVRHSKKNGKEDLEKAKHYIDMIIDRDYSNEKKESWIDGYKKWKKSL